MDSVNDPPAFNDPFIREGEFGGAESLLLDSPNTFYRQVKDGSKVLDVAINLSNAIVGAGIIGIPFALKEAGFFLGLTLLFLMAAISNYALGLSVKCGIALRVRTYDSTALIALGPVGEKAVLASQFAFDYGAALAYLIIAADTSTEVARFLFYPGSDETEIDGLRQLSLGTIAVVFMLPLCLLRDIAGLEKASSLSIFTVVVVFTLILFKMVVRILNPRNNEETGSSSSDGDFLVITRSPWNLVESIGIFAFAFVVNDSVFFYYNSLNQGTPARFQQVLRLALSGSAALTACLGVAGYLTFREDTKANLLNNFSYSDPLATAMRILYVLTMVLTYPICFFVCRQVLHALLSPRGANGQVADVRDISWARHVTYTLGIFVSSVGIAMSTSNLGIVMSLTGNVAGSALGFVLPGLIALSPKVRPHLAALAAHSRDETIESSTSTSSSSSSISSSRCNQLHDTTTECSNDDDVIDNNCDNSSTEVHHSAGGVGEAIHYGRPRRQDGDANSSDKNGARALVVFGVLSLVLGVVSAIGK